MELKPKEIGDLAEYVDKNYDIDQLNALLLTRTELKIRNKFGNGTDFSTYLPILIASLSRRNKEIIPFLFALQSDLDDTAILDRIIFDYGLSMQSYDTDVEHGIAKISALQNLINAEPLLDTDIFLKSLSSNKKCICKVEVYNDNGKIIPGTGFLVGPNKVLTNYHVISPIIEKENILKKIKFRFDYEKSLDSDEFNMGTEYGIDQGNPIAVRSPFSKYDKDGEEDLNIDYPEDQCDYIILNLNEDVGKMPYGINSQNVLKDQERGWIPLKSYDDEDNTNILILQHPEGQSQKLAIGLDKLLGFSKEKRRIRYNVNTLPGSSGSPVFDANFKLMGLHNMGDPRYVPKFNQGIHINTILKDLARQNYTLP